ncbi:MAG: glycoside hydrolase family 127 protein, partial [Abitibacteriaceae bacterium]|nr:glycoside hydrolase family 127 protein [Abditibacteriaceae bacterium]
MKIINQACPTRPGQFRFKWAYPLCWLAFSAICNGKVNAVDGPMGVERVARLTPVGYETPSAGTDDTVRWVQVDLGASRPIDTVKLFPFVDWSPNGVGFPSRFKVEVSDDPEFKTAALVTDQTGKDYPNPHDEVGVFKVNGKAGRYLRLTATHLRNQKLMLTKLEVWSGGKDAAQGCPITDSLKGNLGKTNLTRAPRPQGEEVVTDNPGNVIPAEQWKAVRYAAHAPLSGVRLGDGLFKTAMQNNIAYLMNSFTFDELVRQFRDRAGKPNPPGMRPPDGFWETTLAGSNAGRFMMGAGNTLRWMEDPALRKHMNDIVDVIDECREPNGYIMAYPADTIFVNERAAYTRSWVTHGLIEAGYAGNPKAFGLLRGYYDWFDQNPYLPELLRRGGQGVQGMIANTRMYFTPVGKPQDLQVIQRYFQEDYWMDELSKREDRAIWQYPYDHPHNYLITSLEPYLDMYRATGSRKYLDTALGGWDLYHNHWEHIGGSIAICEGDSYPPDSNYLHRHTGELCGNVFWSRYNQRFHLLYPDQEKYVAEIEKSIYNVALPNQVGTQGILYHANLLGKKDKSSGLNKNTCCEGQGTRMFGSLPEYIYSIAADGLYVDLFAPSEITWQQGGQTLKAQMTTQFPFRPDVALRFSLAQRTKSKIRVRVPAWASQAMPIRVNNKVVATGKPGSYQTIDRTWKDGDTITFTLPAKLTLTEYQGAEQNDRLPRYALQYGPVLMAAVGSNGERPEARFSCTPQELMQHLQPKAGEPLHYAIQNNADYQFVPYWEVRDETFTCFPMIGTGVAITEKISPNDLALASKGAMATADSEYAQEKGSSAKVIDGI